jgi:beta-lactamase regulating signal transducer with metallopeptidase domain
MSLLLATAVKTTVVLLAALAARALVRNQSAAVRHWMLAVAIGCALLMPALGYIAPTWQVPSVTGPDPEVESRVEFNVAATGSPAVPSPRQLPEAPSPPFAIGPFLLALWSGGTVIALAVLLAGLARLAAIAAAAQPAGPGRCDALARAIALAFGINRRIRLLYGSNPSMLMTWGLFRPIVILPESARAWTDDRLRVVLCHELAHIRRGDWGTQLAGDVLRAVYWFNPFAWIACRRLRLDSEHACDDAVLNAGVAAPAYATHLLDLARACSRRRVAWSPALPVARPRKESSCHVECRSESTSAHASRARPDRALVLCSGPVTRGGCLVRPGTLRHRRWIDHRFAARSASQRHARAHEH